MWKSSIAPRLIVCHDIDGNFLCRTLGESIAMVEHLQAIGSTPPAETVAKLNGLIQDIDPDIAGSKKRLGVSESAASTLVEVHAALSKLIEPAKPASLLFIKRQRDKTRIRWTFGAIPIVRWMMVVSLIALILFVVLSASGLVDVNTGTETDSSGSEVRQVDDEEGIENASDSAVTNDESSGFWSIFASQEFFTAIYFVSAALLGSCFANLFRAYTYIAQGTYDHTLDVTYWLRIILGVIAGYIFADLLVGTFDNDFDEALLALLGGFSASAVFRILERMVQALESLVQGDLNGRVRAREAELKARAERRDLENRTALVKDMMATLDNLPDTQEGKTVRDKMRGLIDKTLS